jgi:glycosyltransferase involved in cell wall biosynthesis
MKTAKVGMVGPLGSGRQGRNPAAAMYLHDIVNAMSRLDELNGNPLELHWVCERRVSETIDSPSDDAVPSNVVTEPTWTSTDFVFTIPFKLRKIGVSIVHIHHEPFLFSSTLLHSLGFIILLCLIRILNPKARLILMMANVHVGKMPKDMTRQSPLPAPVTNAGLQTLYRLVLRLAHAVMVAKEAQREMLIQAYGGKEDAIYAALSYTRQPALDIPKEEARKRLDLHQDAYVIIDFGCLSYYKGLEQLLPAFYQDLDLDKDAVLLIAGGSHPRLSYDGKYRRFEQGLRLYAQKHDSPNKRAVFTGWVPSEMIPVYFAAADIAVLPYTGHIASSAALFDAISYEVPVVITRALIEDRLLDNDAITVDSPEPHLIASKIRLVLTNDGIRKTNLDTVRKVKENRLIRNTATQIVDMYEAELAKTRTHQASHSTRETMP